MRSLFTRMILAAYKEHGESRAIDQIQPIHRYEYGWETPTMSRTVNACCCRHISHDYGLWSAYENQIMTRAAAIGEKTLYVGVGFGRFLKHLQGVGIDCTGIDSDDAAVELLGLDGAQNFTKMDGHGLAYSNNSFGLVILPIDTVEQSGNLPALLDEACRVSNTWVIACSSRVGRDSTTEKTSGTWTMKWQGEEETQPYDSYPFLYMKDQLEERGFLHRRNYKNGYPDFPGEEWFLEAESA